MTNKKLYPFTVIGYYDEAGRLFAHHVVADSPENAFAACAESEELAFVDDAYFTCALPGHCKEMHQFYTPGDSETAAIDLRRLNKGCKC